jgi:redox-sensitive bicupin YhaK (pirin superfamily)
MDASVMSARSVAAMHRSEKVAMAEGFTSYNIGPGNLGRAIDPFVNLDDFSMDRPIFRAHPHAGFSAITYIFEDSVGSFVNRWSYGEPQIIGPGAFHWTQAGSGMLHEEVPTVPGTDCHGLQMFVRLPTESELSPPAAFHLDDHEVPEYRSDGARVRILAGSAFGLTSPIDIVNSVTFLDVHLDSGATITVDAPADHNAFVFVIAGESIVETTTLDTHDSAVLAHDGSTITIACPTSSTGCELLYGSGLPLDEEYFSAGPFMLSTEQRLADASDRLRSGDMGRLAPSF